MSFRTPHYDLVAFNAGDAYSSTQDRRRFQIIDNQLEFQSQLIGEGVISGWDVSASSSNSIDVSRGMGIIGGFVTETLGSYRVELSDNNRHYIYMRRRDSVRGATGALGPKTSFTYADVTSPSKVNPPTIITSTLGVNAIEWTPVPEEDVEKYELQRDSGSGFALIYSGKLVSFSDEEVQENTSYTYRVRAVDFTGNAGDWSETVSVTSAQDLRKPSDPVNVSVTKGDTVLHVIWSPALFLVGGYGIDYREINPDGSPSGTWNTTTVSSSTTNVILSGLSNNQFYEIKVYTISPNSVESDGINLRGKPEPSGGQPEIESFSFNDFALSSTTWQVALTLNVTLFNTFPSPSHYLITISRPGEVGEPSIYVDDDAATPHQATFTISRYSLESGTVRTFSEETDYDIKVQTVDSSGRASNGFTFRIRTSKFRPPEPVRSLQMTATFDNTQRSVIAEWLNSTTPGTTNDVKVDRVRLLDDTRTTIFDSNVGTSNRFSVETALVENGFRYEITVTTRDSYGNTGPDAFSSAVISYTPPGSSIPEGIGRPPVPREQRAGSGNGQVTLWWNRSDSEYISQYRIWRATYRADMSAEDFSLISTVDSSVTKLQDFDVSNGTTYAYFVTSVDIYGGESKNPADNGYIRYNLTTATPRSHSDISEGPVINLLQIDNDINISWSPETEPFDGYEIYGKRPDDHEYVKIGEVEASENEFLDENALIKAGNYEYRIRKFRDEAEIYHTTSRIAPAAAVLIAIVDVIDGIVTVNNEVAVQLKMLKDPVETATKSVLREPHHSFESIGDDRRIRLFEDLIVNDWTTDDYITYFTKEDISDTDEKYILVNGERSIISGVIDKSERKLVFSERIFTPSGIEEEDEVNKPSVTVVFENVGETTGSVPRDKIGEVSASKVTKGIISSDSLPNISHFGRRNEKCLPKTRISERIGSNHFSASNHDGIIFYDAIPYVGGRIIAATNRGVMKNVLGEVENWKLVSRMQGPITILSPLTGDRLLAGGPSGARLYDGTSWSEISGLSSSGVIRGVTEISDGTIYLSCDTGVFRWKPGEFKKDIWEQLKVFPDGSIKSYVSWESAGGRLRVSGEGGIWEYDEGSENWSSVCQGIDSACFGFFRGTNEFLISNNKLFRGDGNQFSVVSEFNVPHRKVCILGGRIYISGDDGIKVSSSGTAIDSDTSINFTETFPKFNRNGQKNIAKFMRINNDGRMWVGFDERLYSVTSNSIIVQHADEPGTCPTVFIDGFERSVGVYTYSNGIWFDSDIPKDSVVTHTPDYRNFSCPGGGWIDSAYSSPVTVRVNGRSLGTDSVSTNPDVLAPQVIRIQLPFFNGRTGNDLAVEAMRRLVKRTDELETLSDIQNTPDPATGLITEQPVPASLMSQIFREIETIRANVSPSVRDDLVIPEIGKQFPSGEAKFDAVTGDVTFFGTLNKYDDVRMDVEGVGISSVGTYSHEELDSFIDRINIGTDTNFGLARLTNAVEAGVKDAGLAGNGPSWYQAKFDTGCDNWYDSFNSTLDWTNSFSQDSDAGISVDYPTDVLHVSESNEVWVSGAEGVVAINTNDYGVKTVLKTGYVFNMNRDLDNVNIFADDGLYVVNVSTGMSRKDVDIKVPPTANGFLSSSGNSFITTFDGLYVKRQGEVDWKKLFSIDFPKSRQVGDVFFAFGDNPDDENGSLVFYSHSGVVWNRSMQLSGVKVVAAARRTDWVYYASDKGLIIEDLSRLLTGDGKRDSVRLADILPANASRHVNDVAADDEAVFAGGSDGYWWKLQGDEVVDSGQSRLKTIHRLLVVNGLRWSFAHDMVDIDGATHPVQIATGRPLK